MVSPTVDNQMLLTNFLKKKQSWIAKYPCRKESSRYQQVELLLPLRQWMNLRLKMHYNDFLFFAMEATISIRAGMCIHLLDLEKAGWGIALLSSCRILLHNFFHCFSWCFYCYKEKFWGYLHSYQFASQLGHVARWPMHPVYIYRKRLFRWSLIYSLTEERTVTTTDVARIVHLLTSP